jgi:FtsZ-interacting cell division protein ZipA
MKKVYADHVRKERDREQKDIEEIKEREKNLLEDVQKTEEDPLERYTVLKTKKAQLTWTYLETEKKMEQMRTLIAKARKELEEIDEKHPDAKDKFYEKYVEARRQANLPTDRDVLQNSFMRFMVEDVTIPAIDEEYRKLYESEN